MARAWSGSDQRPESGQGVVGEADRSVVGLRTESGPDDQRRTLLRQLQERLMRGT